MPWLTTHIALPLILVSGWAIGQFIDGTDWQIFRERRAWMAALLLPITAVAAFSAVSMRLKQASSTATTEMGRLRA
jgi:hypothetical protein